MPVARCAGCSRWKEAAYRRPGVRAPGKVLAVLSGISAHSAICGAVDASVVGWTRILGGCRRGCRAASGCLRVDAAAGSEILKICRYYRGDEFDRRRTALAG